MIHDRILKSETRQCKIIFPNSLNDNKTLFGGIAMKWMDEVAYISAIRFTRKKMITVSVEKTKFLKVIKEGMIAEIIAKVINVSNVKIEIKVEIFIESLFSDNKIKAIESNFIFAAVDENNNPIRIN